MYVTTQVTDSVTVTGDTVLKAGTVLEKDGTNYKVLETAENADAVLMQDTTPTAEGVVSVALFGGVVERKDELLLPTDVTVTQIKDVLRVKGIYIRGA